MHSYGLGPERKKLVRFYEVDYLKNNPDLGVQDIPLKFECFQRLMRDAGIHPKSILDVGCGSGMLLDKAGAFMSAGLLIGCDVSFNIIKKYRRGNISRIAADALKIPLRDKSVDFAYCADLLEHVLDPLECLREMRRVCGRIAVFAPLESGLISDPHNSYRTFFKKMTNLEQFGHIHRFAEKDIFALLEKAGLRPRKFIVRRLPIFKAKTPGGRFYEIIQRLLSLLPEGVYRRLYGASYLGVYCEADNA
jgi:SAM-dependent methyltransferase